MEVPGYIVAAVRDMIDKRTADVAARVTGVPRRNLFRIVSGRPVRRATLDRLTSFVHSGTSGTNTPAQPVHSEKVSG